MQSFCAYVSAAPSEQPAASMNVEMGLPDKPMAHGRLRSRLLRHEGDGHTAGRVPTERR